MEILAKVSIINLVTKWNKTRKEYFSSAEHYNIKSHIKALIILQDGHGQL